MGDVQSVVQKAVSDESFRKQLLANPEGILKENGVTPTPEMIKTLKGMDEATLKEFASNYDRNKAAC